MKEIQCQYFINLINVGCEMNFKEKLVCCETLCKSLVVLDKTIQAHVNAKLT